ncbi:MAG: TauD/TfdA dioxygenase family protein [Acidimicrobiia bacterium]
MQFEPVNASIGATVTGVALNNLSPAEVDEVNAAWAKYGVLFFHDQEISPDQHVILAEQLGDIDINRFFAHIDDYEMIADVRKEASDELNIGGGWHTDHSYDPEPAKGSILIARDVPPSGGDTRFLSTETAWRTLPDDLKAKVQNLEAVHSSEHIFGPDSDYAKQMGERFGNSSAVNTTTHPVVIAHPVTGNPVLYVNPAFTLGVVGLEPDESKQLLDTLHTHIGREEHSCQFSWSVGSVAIWDNRSTWHWALNDYPGYRRQMHRITLAGDPLYAAKVALPA